jgi:hypothetical protein
MGDIVHATGSTSCGGQPRRPKWRGALLLNFLCTLVRVGMRGVDTGPCKGLTGCASACECSVRWMCSSNCALSASLTLTRTPLPRMRAPLSLSCVHCLRGCICWACSCPERYQHVRGPAFALTDMRRSHPTLLLGTWLTVARLHPAAPPRPTVAPVPCSRLSAPCRRALPAETAVPHLPHRRSRQTACTG